MTATTTLPNLLLKAQAGRESLWTRIACELVAAIGTRVLAPGQRLPCEHALSHAKVTALFKQIQSCPVLQVENLNVDAQTTPIEFAAAWFAGDRVKLTVSHDAY